MKWQALQLYPCASGELDWHRWLNWDCPDIVRIGLIGAREASLMQSKSRQVLGAKSYVQKLRFKHRILPVEADLIQSLLDTATIITLPRQPGAFQFHGAAGADKRRYKLILKVVNNEQVWLSTLFRSDMATFRAATRKGLILKE